MSVLGRKSNTIPPPHTPNYQPQKSKFPLFHTPDCPPRPSTPARGRSGGAEPHGICGLPGRRRPAISPDPETHGSITGLEFESPRGSPCSPSNLSVFLYQSEIAKAGRHHSIRNPAKPLFRRIEMSLQYPKYFLHSPARIAAVPG